MTNKKGQHMASPKQSRLNDTSAHAQRQRLLTYLRDTGSVTTVYARDSLGIMSPAPRVKELRDKGCNIITERVDATDSLGVVHHGVAQYILIAEATLGVKSDRFA